MRSRRRFFATAALALVVAMATLRTNVISAQSAVLPDASACVTPTHTLTFDCDDACDAFSPCIVTETTFSTTLSPLEANASTTNCTLTCFQMNQTAPETYDRFVFLVPFGTNATNTATSGSNRNGRNDTSRFPSESNDVVQRIDTLALPNTTFYVSIIGGSVAASTNVKGDVVNLEFASDLLTESPQVGIVAFENVNLSSQAGNVSAMLPPNVSRLMLQNARLTSIPTGLSELKGLERLNLSRNNIRSFAAQFPAMTKLDLSSNELSEVPVILSDYPKLLELELNANQLTTIERVHTIGSLEKLYLDENPITNVTLTEAQADFLASLRNFTIDAASMSTYCDAFQQREIHGKRYCVLEDDFASDENQSAAGTPNPLQSSSEKSSSPLGVVLGVISAVIALAIIVGVYLLWTSKGKQNSLSGPNEEGAGAAHAAMTSDNSPEEFLGNDPKMLAVQVKGDDIQDVSLIGTGTFTEVWLVRYRGTQAFASTRLIKSYITHERTQSFVKRIKIVAKLDHPKIVQFVGAAWTTESDLQALYEYMKGGELRNYLDNPRTPRVWTPEKVKIAIDITEALVYVHSFSPPLAHRNLTSRNVLLSKYLEAKLIGFGSPHVELDDILTAEAEERHRWFAPEVLSGSSDYGPAADVFSLGVLLTELDSHALPYSDEIAHSDTASGSWVQQVSVGHLRPIVNASSPDAIAELANQCLAFDPEDRPSAAKAAEVLRAIKEQKIVRL
ncbi:Tkl protein kinase, partial [Globisporangium splendens]